MNITQIAGGIVLVDITNELPRHAFRRYSNRQHQIIRQYFHNSGKLGAPGFRGCYNSARYCVAKRKVPKKYPRSHILGWAGMPYTFWQCFEKYTVKMADLIDGIIDREWDLYGSELVYFRCQPDHLRTWHTGGYANQIGVACSFQGATSKRDLSRWQIEITEAHIPWSNSYYNLTLPDGLSWHSDKSEYGPLRVKPSCPGRSAEQWLRAYRDGG